MKLRLFSLTIIFAILISACNPHQTEKPSTITTPTIHETDFDLHGIVLDTLFSANGNNFYMLGYDEKNAQPHYGVGIVNILPDAEFFIQKEDDLYHASPEDMVFGQKVSLILEEGIIDTYPWVTKALTIFMWDEGPQASAIPLSTWIEPQIEGTIIDVTGSLEDRKSDKPNLIVDGFNTRTNITNRFSYLQINDTSFIWLKEKAGYRLTSFESLNVGQKVTLLMREPFNNYSAGPAHTVLEIIILND